MLNTKLAAINPAMDSKYYGKLSDDEIAKAEAHVLKMWNERSTSSSPARNRQPRLFATTEKTGKPNKKPKQTKRKTTKNRTKQGVSWGPGATFFPKQECLESTKVVTRHVRTTAMGSMGAAHEGFALPGGMYNL